jgi:hypothetical protein
MGKEDDLTRPEGTMGCALTSRQHQSDFKKTIVKIFSFIWEMVCLLLNVTQSSFPLIVEFDACQVPPCTDLMSQLQLQGYSSICIPSLDPQGSLVSVQSGRMRGVALDIKDTLPLFMKILRAGLGPRALEIL